MNSSAKMQELRRATNPLFNDRKLKLGTFCTNLSGGYAITTMPGTLEVTWPNTVRLAQLADEMEFEALVPVGRWKGFGGVTNFNGAGFECFSWAAGISASTKYSSVFSTSHIHTIHPVMAAKQATVIDHISGGRHAINIVSGWNQPELDMFGAPMLDHDARYQMAGEWIEIMMKLWTLEEDFDYDGKFYQVKKGCLAPKPLQRPYPAIMNAGGSDQGRHFSAKYSDIAFVQFDTHDPDFARKKVESYRRLAREKYGREIQVWSFGYVVQRETEKEAKDFLHYYVYEKGDWAAAGNLIDMLGLGSLAVEPSAFEKLKAHFMGGWGAFPLVGTKEQIVDGLATLSDIGVDGALLSWPLYEEGMLAFQCETMPLLKQAGLR
jgi:alkanesulfonate monooxygenase SsuD/methylene tetrahydromethanopterin reductase-like flavin-dependent oxidoreductase (luciferase family)